MSKKPQADQKRLIAVDFARQITKLTEPEVFERALKAVQEKNKTEFNKICKELKINTKIGDQMWNDFMEWKPDDVNEGWSSGWPSGPG